MQAICYLALPLWATNCVRSSPEWVKKVQQAKEDRDLNALLSHVTMATFSAFAAVVLYDITQFGVKFLASKGMAFLGVGMHPALRFSLSLITDLFMLTLVSAKFMGIYREVLEVVVEETTGREGYKSPLLPAPFNSIESHKDVQQRAEVDELFQNLHEHGIATAISHWFKANILGNR